ncbi:MAG: NUDIX domain-containing protein [Reyranellaceae bacterium]
MTAAALLMDLHLILRDGARVLLGLRKNTGFGDGMYHLPAGRLENDETIVAGMIREAKEELDIEIDAADLMLVHAMHHRTGRLALFFEARAWSGTIANGEPDKCDRLDWIVPQALPPNTVAYAREALQLISEGCTVGAFGWDGG